MASFSCRSRRDAAVDETTINLVYCGILPTAAAAVDKPKLTRFIVVLSTAASFLLRRPLAIAVYSHTHIREGGHPPRVGRERER